MDCVRLIGIVRELAHVVDQALSGLLRVGRLAVRQEVEQPGLAIELADGVERFGDAVGVAQNGFSRFEHSAETTVGDRSEEHTSELQSLMRISYAVFCLKKKK